MLRLCTFLPHFLSLPAQTSRAKRVCRSREPQVKSVVAKTVRSVKSKGKVRKAKVAKKVKAREAAKSKPRTGMIVDLTYDEIVIEMDQVGVDLGYPNYKFGSTLDKLVTLGHSDDAKHQQMRVLLKDFVEKMG